jgi:hypothetical protein
MNPNKVNIFTQKAHMFIFSLCLISFRKDFFLDSFFHCHATISTGQSQRSQTEVKAIKISFIKKKAFGIGELDSSIELSSVSSKYNTENQSQTEVKAVKITFLFKKKKLWNEGLDSTIEVRSVPNTAQTNGHL